jgi:hypothetical protein
VTWDLIESLDLPASLLHQARSLEHLGIPDRAWPRTAALDVVARLEGTPIAVLGGHVLIRTDKDLRHNYDNWHSDPRPNESFADYASRSQVDGRTYISQYPDRPPEPFFTLVLANRLR